MTTPHKLFRLLVLGGAVLAVAPACGPGADDESPGTSSKTLAKKTSSDGGVAPNDGDDGTGPRMW